MHELGLIVHVIKTVKRISEENGANRINKVTLEIGEVSGIVEDYLQKYWKWTIDQEESTLKNASLEIITIPAKTVCRNCGTVYRTLDYGKKCPSCGSIRTFLIQGDEMNIENIEAAFS